MCSISAWRSRTSSLSDPRRTREKIASVALEAGFGDVSYFYRAFRRRYDVLPTDVRAQAQGLH